MVTIPCKQNIQSDRTNAQLLQASLSSMSALMALQLFSRLFTFSLNQAMFRMVSPKAFGTAAIQFELLLSTILFLSRDGVRNALLRAWPLATTDEKQVSGIPTETRTTQQDSSSTAITNLGFIPFILGLPLAVTMSYVYAKAVAHDTRSQPHFNLAIPIYATAAVVELLSEPFHNR
jgi:oligosaccharide translocation protein RFT1